MNNWGAADMHDPASEWRRFHNKDICNWRWVWIAANHNMCFIFIAPSSLKVIEYIKYINILRTPCKTTLRWGLTSQWLRDWKTTCVLFSTSEYCYVNLRLGWLTNTIVHTCLTDKYSCTHLTNTIAHTWLIQLHIWQMQLRALVWLAQDKQSAASRFPTT